MSIFDLSPIHALRVLHGKKITTEKMKKIGEATNARIRENVNI
jgi:hypothetical protein